MNALSKYNTFFSIDIEGNSVYDVTENGVSNHYMNAIATTVIFGTTATWDVWDDGNIQVGNLTNNAPANNGNASCNTVFITRLLCCGQTTCKRPDQARCLCPASLTCGQVLPV